MEAPKAQSSVVPTALHTYSLKAPHWNRWDPKLENQHNSKSAGIKHKPLSFSHSALVQERSAEFGLYMQAQGIGIFPVNMTQELTCAQQLYRQSCDWAFRCSLQEIAHRLCLLPELGAVQRATEREEISLHSWRRSSGTSSPLHCCWSHAVKKMGCVVHATVTISFQEW